jgi:hypothetical protein
MAIDFVEEYQAIPSKIPSKKFRTEGGLVAISSGDSSNTAGNEGRRKARTGELCSLHNCFSEPCVVGA